MVDHMASGDDDAKGHGASTRRWSFILSVWAEPLREAGSGPLCWRGYLETPARQRNYFATLDDLNRLLTKSTGWRDEMSG